MTKFLCRPGCGACCIAPSISSPLPGLPNGKPAGMRCPHLDESFLCRLWGRAEFPEVCGKFPPGPEVCGKDQREALTLLEALEQATCPKSL